MNTDNVENLIGELNFYKNLKRQFCKIHPPIIKVIIDDTKYHNPHLNKELVPIVERHILNSITNIENEIRSIVKEQWI